MTCTPFKIDGRVAGVVCSRAPRRKRCSACGNLGKLECDGCDKPLCAECSVSLGKHPDASLGSLDYCPACCRPIFKEWCAGPGAVYRVPKPGVTELTNKMLRRAAFRRWATANPEKFKPLFKEPR